MNSPSDDGIVRGMSDEEEARRWAESVGIQGFGDEIIVDSTDEARELGLIPE